MRKGDILEQQRLGLETILSNFFPIDFSIKGRKLILSEESEKLYQNADYAVNLSNKVDRPIPDSTRDIYRFSKSFLEDIWPNIDDYSVVKEKKMLAKRKGSFSVAFVTWDQRKIEITLKKSPKPECKSEKDSKALKKFKNEIKTFFLEHNQKELRNAADLLEKYFIHPNKESTKMSKQIIQDIKEIETYQDIIEKTKQNEGEIKAEIAKNAKIIYSTSKELEELETSFISSQFGMNYTNIQKEIDDLNQNEDIRQYLRILDNVGRKYYTYITKQGSILPMQQQTLELFLNEPLDPKFSEEIFKELVDMFCQSSDELFAGKKWYSRQFGNSEALNFFLTVDKSAKLFLKLKNQMKIIAELENNDHFKDYSNHKNKIMRILRESDTVKEELADKIEKINERLNTSKKEMEKLKKELIKLIS